MDSAEIPIFVVDYLLPHTMQPAMIVRMVKVGNERLRIDGVLLNTPMVRKMNVVRIDHYGSYAHHTPPPPLPRP